MELLPHDVQLAPLTSDFIPLLARPEILRVSRKISPTTSLASLTLAPDRFFTNVSDRLVHSSIEDPFATMFYDDFFYRRMVGLCCMFFIDVEDIGDAKSLR